MPELNIYTSEGEPYGDGSRRKNDQIENFFFDGVRLAADFSRGAKITCFFRAREQSGRAEQYYAVYEASRRPTNPFREFVETLQDRVEGEFGLDIDTTADDTAVFTALTGNQSRESPPGSNFEQSTINRLLGQGQRLRVGVRDVYRALALGRWATDEASARSFAIADNTGGNALSSYDLAIETGAYSGIEPLGDTVEHFDTAKREQQSQYVSTKVSSIRSEVQDLRTETTLSSSQIRAHLKRDLNLFDDPEPDAFKSDDGGDSIFDPLPGSNRVGLVATGLVVVLLLAAAVVTAAVTMFGVSVPVVSDVLGDDGNSPEIVEASGAHVAMSNDTLEVTDPNPSVVLNVTGFDTPANISIQQEGESIWDDGEFAADSGEFSIDLNTSSLQSEINYSLTLNSTESDRSASLPLVYTGPETSSEEQSVDITSISGSNVSVPEDGNVTLEKSTVSMTFATEGFDGDVRVSLLSGTGDGATAQQGDKDASSNFTVNWSNLDVEPGQTYELLVDSEPDGTTDDSWNLTYEPPVIDEISGVENASIEGETVTVTGPATVNVSSAYSELTVNLPNTSDQDTLDTASGAAEFNLDANETASGEELVITADGTTEERRWTYEVDTSS